MTAGAANTATALTLDGVVASVVLSLGRTIVTGGTSTSVPLSVSALDAGGKLIIGGGGYVDANGDPLTITLADHDPSGATTLSASSLTSPTSGLSVNYDGSDTFFLAPLTASVSGGTFSGDVTSASLTIAAPTITSIDRATWVVPTSGVTTFTESFTGTNFVDDPTTHAQFVDSSGNAVPNSTAQVMPPTVGGSTTASTAVTIPPNAPTGIYALEIVTAGGKASIPFTIANGQIVTRVDDTAAAASTGVNEGILGTGPGVSDDLRYAVQNAGSGGTIVFDRRTTCSITLAGPLPPVTSDLTIDGGSSTVIDGGSAYRVFFLDRGNVTVENLTVQNALVHGGNGGGRGSHFRQWRTRCGRLLFRKLRARDAHRRHVERVHRDRRRRRER